MEDRSLSQKSKFIYFRTQRDNKIKYVQYIPNTNMKGQYWCLDVPEDAARGYCTPAPLPASAAAQRSIPPFSTRMHGALAAAVDNYGR
jgi:hypothetical protein